MDDNFLSLFLGSLLFPYAVIRILEWLANRVPFFGKWLAAPFHWLRTKYVFVLMWPFKKIWGLMSSAAKKSVEAAWRGFVIVIKWLFAAAWRGVVIVSAAAWQGVKNLAGRARSRLRGGTP